VDILSISIESGNSTFSADDFFLFKDSRNASDSILCSCESDSNEIEESELQ
jgi:hypothetical protein